MFQKLAWGSGLVAAAILGVPSAASTSPEPAPARSAQPPNVVLLMVDDATVEDMEYMPNVQRLLVQRGTTFTRNYSPYPLCCPARATTLTGQYPHNHGVLDNVAPLGGASAFDDTDTIATYITDDYDTAIVGKYLNDFDTARYVPPGWDTWKVPVKGTTLDYMNQTLSVNGRLVDFADTFVTANDGRLVRRFIDKATGPYFAFASFIAPHSGSPRESPDDPFGTPYVEPKYQDTYTGSVLPEDPTFNEADVSDKRPAVANQPLLTSDQITYISEQLAQRREALRSVDDEIARIVGKVRRLGQLDNTYFIFVSDNGFVQGEHRIASGKSAAYESASRVPLVISGPGIPIGTYDNVTGLQDITPTILSMTGQWGDQPVAPIDGMSLLDLLAGQATARAQVLETVHGAKLTDAQVEAGATPSTQMRQRLVSGSVPWDMRGIVTSDGWKYTEYPQTSEVEMYDLSTDPYEEQNVAGLPTYKAQQGRLERLYQQYRSCEGAGCR
jgi:N-acetylglucosamine-6-sulfatase